MRTIIHRLSNLRGSMFYVNNTRTIPVNIIYSSEEEEENFYCLQSSLKYIEVGGRQSVEVRVRKVECNKKYYSCD